MTLVKEDGTGLANANSYANVVDSNTYHESHLYAADWNDSAPDVKTGSLIWSTRTIDMLMEYGGYKGSAEQSLEFPRIYLPNDDELWSMVPGASLLGGYSYGGQYFPSDEVPIRLIYATCELARELIKADRTADYKAKGVSHLGLGQGALTIDFSGGTSSSDRPGVFTDIVKAMLQPLGQIRLGRSVVKAVRG